MTDDHEPPTIDATHELGFLLFQAQQQAQDAQLGLPRGTAIEDAWRGLDPERQAHFAATAERFVQAGKPDGAQLDRTQLFGRIQLVLGGQAVRHALPAVVDVAAAVVGFATPDQASAGRLLLDLFGDIANSIELNRDAIEAARASGAMVPWSLAPAKTQQARTCRFCGCTDAQACPDGCSWVAADVCSNPACSAAWAPERLAAAAGDADRQLLARLHAWFVDQAPEKYQGCGLWFDVEATLAHRPPGDFATRTTREVILAAQLGQALVALDAIAAMADGKPDDPADALATIRDRALGWDRGVAP